MYRLSPLRNLIPRNLAIARRPPSPHLGIVAVGIRWHSTPAQSPTMTSPVTASAGAAATSPMIPAAEAPGSVQPSVIGDVLSVPQYEKIANETMENLYDALEALVEEWSPEGTHGWEIEYSSGVLTLSLGPHGTYVINKQPPTQQIWLSSPFSGPMRFSYIAPNDTTTTTAASDAAAEGPVWFYTRDKITLGALLEQEIRSVLAAEVGEGEAQSWPGVAVR